MTDAETAVETKPRAPAPKPKASPTLPNGTPDRLAMLEAQIAELKAQAPPQMQTIPQQPPRRPEAFPADPTAAATPLLRKLLERTSPTPPDYRPEGVSYNHRMRWFCRPDADVVQLPGNPEAIKMYLDMGFTLLSDAETREWLEHDRDIVLKDQRERARLINAVRNAARTEPKLAYAISDEAELDMQRMTTPELRERAKAVVGEDLKHFARPQRLVDAEEQAANRRDKEMLKGLDTHDSLSREGFEQKLQRANGRSVEIQPGRGQAFA
jgi:hypothetical protein